MGKHRNQRAICTTTVLGVVLSFLVGTAHARTDIKLAHQLEGQHETELQQLVARFNQGQNDVTIQLVKQPAAAKPAVLNLSTVPTSSSTSATPKAMSRLKNS